MTRRDNDSRLRRLAVSVLGGPIAAATLGFEEGAVPLLVLSSVSGIAILACFCLMASWLYSIDLPRFDNHDIYYLFRHRRVKYRKRITFLNKAVTHELSAHILFLFSEKNRRPAAGCRCTRMYCGVGRWGETGRQVVTNLKGSSLSSVHVARLACVRLLSEKGQRGDRPFHLAGFKSNWHQLLNVAWKTGNCFQSILIFFFHILKLVITVSPQRWFCWETAGNNWGSLHFDEYQRHLKNLSRYTWPHTSRAGPHCAHTSAGRGESLSSRGGTLCPCPPSPDLLPRR